MNQFGGAGVGKDLGLWDRNDPNNPLKFMTLEEYQSIGKYGIIPYPVSLKERKAGALALSGLTTITYVPTRLGRRAASGGAVCAAVAADFRHQSANGGFGGKQ